MDQVKNTKGVAMGKEDFLIQEEQKVSRKLKMAGYESKKNSYPFSFLIRNEKTDLMIEVNGCSLMHVCSMVGWRARSVELIEKKSVNEGN